MNDIKVLPFTDGQKEVIEATKKICNGKKVCDVDDDIDVLTNEEYLKSCNTEQLAEFITDIVYECKEQDDCMDCKLGWCSCNYVAKWLKEKHHD